MLRKPQGACKIEIQGNVDVGPSNCLQQTQSTSNGK